jgi:hypothetical protein
LGNSPRETNKELRTEGACGALCGLEGKINLPSQSPFCFWWLLGKGGGEGGAAKRDLVVIKNPDILDRILKRQVPETGFSKLENRENSFSIQVRSLF